MKPTNLASRRCSAVSSGLFQLQRVGQVGAQLGDLLFHTLEHVGDVRGVGDLLLDATEDHLLGKRSAHQRLVPARAVRGGQTAVVATALAAHLSNGGTT